MANNSFVLSSPFPPISPTDRARCQPDPLDPTVICLARVTADDRQGISHFFGRNKKATLTIPGDIFPILCRTHYQEKQYRWNESPGGLAAFQCDCIMKSLERMASRTWTDDYDIEWPYWCGFELQICKVTNSGNIDSDRHQVPNWLRKLCKKHETGQDFIPLGDRAGARYDFPQLFRIVRSIKSWCLEQNCRLPSVEALPVTIGLINEVELEVAKVGLRDATRVWNLAQAKVRRAESEDSEALEVLRGELEKAEEGLDLANDVLELSTQDYGATKILVPEKRPPMRRRKTETPDTVARMDGSLSAREQFGSIEVRKKKAKV